MGPPSSRPRLGHRPVYFLIPIMARHKYDESAADLAADIVESARQLVRLEIALAKQEAKELAIQNGIAVGLMAAGGLLLMLGVLVMIPILVVAATESWWWAAAFVVLYVGGGGLAILIGKSRLKIQAPQRTISSLKETRAWVLHQLTTNGK